jgi:hypothetical protein
MIVQTLGGLGAHRKSGILTLPFLCLYVRHALQNMQPTSRRVAVQDGRLRKLVGRGLAEDSADALPDAAGGEGVTGRLSRKP